MESERADGGADGETETGLTARPVYLEVGGRLTGHSEVAGVVEPADHGWLWRVVERINLGLGMEEILDRLFAEFHEVVPYNRVSYAVVEQDTGMVVARWTRSDEESPRIAAGYTQPLAFGSLAEIARSGRTRVINDLAAYHREHPDSDGTRRLLEEGMRSSLTCPLRVGGQPVGFLFFNSRAVGAYAERHLERFHQVAGLVSGLLERGRVFSELAAQKAVIEEQGRLRDEELRRSQEELELARKVQRALIPAALPTCEQLSMAMHYEPAAKIGGDLLDCVRLSDSTALLYVADAMGHGVPAALLMTAVRTAFHGALARQPRSGSPSPATVLGEVNCTLTDLLGQGLVTAACVRVDSGADALTMALAGHPPALLRRGFAAEVDEVGATGIPLGISGESRYADVVVPFAPGDTLLLYTDGVTEASAPDGAFFEIAGLRQELREWRGGSPEALVGQLRRAVAKHRGQATLDDDLTILAVQATPFR